MQVLRTKFHIPDPGEQIPRPRLMEILDNRSSLVMVRAPAGFGKTSILSQWVYARNRVKDTAWLSIESRDNHPFLFWQYLILSFEHIAPGMFSSATAMLASGGDAVPEDLLIGVINRIEKSPRKFILVLDDFHLISHPLILEGVNFLMDHPIDTLRIMVASRQIPDLGISRHRVSGRLREITEADLRFDKKEIRALTSSVSARFPNVPPLDDPALELLKTKTEGWAAALKLVLLSGRGKPGMDVSGSTRFIQEYLLEEVFSTIPPAMGALMARLSILDRFSPALVRVFSDPAPEADFPEDPIDFMGRRQLFLIPLDDTGQWYRFHHLFQAFLNRQLEDGGNRQGLHKTAFYWFESMGLFEEAFDHALKAGEAGLAARVLSSHSADLYGQGGDHILQPYLEQLPKGVIEATPVLAAYYYCMKIFNGDFKAIEDFGNCLAMECRPREKRLLQGFYDFIIGYHAFYGPGDLDLTIEKALSALEIIPESHGSSRRVLEFMLTLSFRLKGDITRAREFARPRPTDTLLMSGMKGMNQAYLEMELGNLRRAREILDREIKAIEAVFSEQVPPIFGYLYVSRAEVYKEENRMDAANSFFLKGLKVIGEIGYPEFTIISHGKYALFLSGLGRFPQALEAVDHALSIAGQTRSWIGILLEAQKQQIRMGQGRKDLVRPWAEALMAQNLEISSKYSTLYLVLARYHLAEKQWEQAGAILDALILMDEKNGCSRELMEAFLLRARAEACSGEDERAGTFICRAWELCGNEGYLSLFLDELPGTEGIYKKLISRGKLKGLPKEIPDRIQSGAAPRTVCVSDFQESFNQREIQVLELFQKGASNREIAEALFLSVNTVRWYAGRIFAKLGVKRRGQAVSEAVRLKLI